MSEKPILHLGGHLHGEKLETNKVLQKITHTDKPDTFYRRVRGRHEDGTQMEVMVHSDLFGEQTSAGQTCYVADAYFQGFLDGRESK